MRLQLPAATHRLFADDYSSTGQEDWKRGLRGASGKYWGSDFLGQLRFDSLTSETLVVPDSHIFDGLFFLQVHPQDLVKHLGRGAPGASGEALVLPLEIRARKPTLAESLADLLRRSDSHQLNHYIFKVIEDPDLRDRVAQEIARTPIDELDRAISRHGPVRGVTTILQACFDRADARESAAEPIGVLERGWSQWVAFEHHLRIQQWDKQRPFELSAALKQEPLPSGRLQTDIGREALRLATRLVAHGSSYRGDVSRELKRLEDSATADGRSGLAEVEMVSRWYSRGRYRAIAWQHGCSCVQVDRPWLEPVSPLQALYRELLSRPEPALVPLPEGILSALGDLPDDDFRRLAYNHRRELSAWWRDGDFRSLERAADELAQLAPLKPSARNRVGVSELIGVAGPIGGAAAGGVVGGPVGAVVGAVIGSAAKLVAGRLKTPTERDKIRARILEAWPPRRGQPPG